MTENNPTKLDVNDDQPQEIDVDLDSLVKGSKKVRLHGKIIEIFPPELEEIIKLKKLEDLLKSTQRTKTVKKKIRGEMVKVKEKIPMSDEDAIKTLKQLKSLFVEMIPQLQGYKINYAQLIALSELLLSMAMPENLKELEKRGIKLDAKQKKIISNYQEKFQNSSTSTPATPSKK